MVNDKLNRPLKDLRISVTDRCNFRCNYCMPEDIFGEKYQFLSRDKILTFEEIHRLAKLSAQLGVTKIRLTGGEPLLRAEVEKLVALLSSIPEIRDIALTTNGYILPQKSELLWQAGLRRLTISLDTLNPALFTKLAGKHLNLSQVMDGIKAAQDTGFSPIKINTVIQKGINEKEIPELLDFAFKNNLIIRFIEYMDVGNLNGWQADEVFSFHQILDSIKKTHTVKSLEKNYNGEVAGRFFIENRNQEFGIISSVSSPFCGTCTRARLSADGKIYTCLFAANGTDIKTDMRAGATDEQLLDKLRLIWQNRYDRYSEERDKKTPELNKAKVEMYHIGG